jgi:hypothetical protein
LAIIFTFVFLPNNPAVGLAGDSSPFQRWKKLDWIGVSLSFAAVTVLLIALQWGGNQKPWNDPSLIALLVLVIILVYWTTDLLTDSMAVPSLERRIHNVGA